MMMCFPSLPRSHHLILLVFLIFICGQNYAATPYTIVFSLLLLPFSRSRYCFQHPVFKHCQYMFVHYGDRPSFTPYKARGKITCCIFSSLIFIEIYLTSWQYFSPVTSIVGWQTGQELKRTWKEADMVWSSYFPIISLKRIFSVMVVACVICRLWNL